MEQGEPALVKSMTGYGRGEAVVIGCDPNTSLYFTNVHLPAVKYHIPKGHTELDTEVFDEAD